MFLVGNPYKKASFPLLLEGVVPTQSVGFSHPSSSICNPRHPVAPPEVRYLNLRSSSPGCLGEGFIIIQKEPPLLVGGF